MASVTITGPAEPLDRLTDALAAEPDFELRRLALEALEAHVNGAAGFLVRMRVEAKLRHIDGRELARLA